MKIINKLSIKQSFFILFFICISIFIGFGIFALVELSSLSKVTYNLYNQSSKISNASVQAKLNLIKINSSIKEVILSSTSDEIQDEIDKVNEYESDLQNNLNTISENSVDSNTKRNLQDANNLLSKWWKPERERIIKYVQEGKKDAAIEISKGISSDFVDQLELDLNNIYLSSSDDEVTLMNELTKLQDSGKITLIVTLIILICILVVTFIAVIRSILIPINRVKNHMSMISETGELEEIEILQKTEISQMGKNYNVLINKLKDEFWVNESRNSLTDQLAGNLSVKELTQKTINVLAGLLDAGSGAFYIYNQNENKLILNSTFAFTERDRLANVFEIGQGIVGQVALERKPILIKSVRRSDSVIYSATICEAPLNIYAFPLIYEGELCGVIEISSFEVIDNLKQKLIEVAQGIIAINLFSALQNEKIKELLHISEKATNEANEASVQLKNANQVLEEQQRQLQVQTEELQETNAQLEEQQQILKQQSEELQQSNTQLEEHQSQMEEQSRLLSIKNDELEESKKEILKRVKDYEMANKYKSQFLANISHELRTPLNSIILLSNLLIRASKDNIKDSEQEKIKVIYNAGQHLHRLINDILDLSKIEAGRLDLNYRNFHSSELIEELGEIFDQIAKEKNIEFILDDEFKNQIYCDKDRISQILRNFLSNAFKFTEQGTILLKVELDKKGEDNIVFSVMDTGIGISKEKLDIIFEEFHQADGSISRKYGGTGLGLSICSKLSELLNGEIKVESNLGIGSTFSLHLPLTAVNPESFEKEKAIENNNETKNIESIKAEEVKNKDQKKLLIIEDDKTLIHAVKSISEGIGFVPLISSSGIEGLQIIKDNDIDGILLDLGLPDIRGIDLLKEINELLKMKQINIPVIIYTGMEISMEKEKEIMSYADSIIIKTENSHERLLDELTLVLNKVKNKDEYKTFVTSKINKESALNLDGKKILVVDDDPKNVFVLAAALEEYGAEILEAENGKEALEKLKDEVVDLILMDVMMPVMNGYEAIEKIRNTDKIKDIPIITITAKSLKGDREKCIEAGANDYISKPIDYDTLITLIKAWINKS